MAKATTLQSNFNAGELSPLLYGRTDSPRYKQGLDTCQNYIPTLQGPLVRRPGTKFMNEVKDSTKPPVLIPFQFSLTQNYILEFGDQYIRFYANNGQVVTVGDTYRSLSMSYMAFGAYQLFFSRSSNTYNPGETGLMTGVVASGSILEVPSPFLHADLSNIKYAQSADTLYLFHPSYPPYKLQRFGNQDWDLKQVYLQDGPYLPLNSYSKLSDSAAVTLTPSNITTSSPSYTVANLTSGTAFTVSATASLGGQIKITTSANHNFSEGQKVFITGVLGTVEANNNDSAGSHPAAPYYWTITTVTLNTFVLVGSTYINAFAASTGTVVPSLFHRNMGLAIQPDKTRLISCIIAGARYWGTIISILDASKISVNMGPYGTAIPFPSTTTATAWQMGVYDNISGPACGTFHQNRLAMAGDLNYPQQVDFSYVGQYENFAASDRATLATTSANAMQFTLSSSESNPIQWLKSTAQALLAGSSNAEWSMTPSSASDALTATNFNAAQTSFYGSANADAVLMGNAAIYIQRAGRKVRELHYFFQVGTFRATDLTELSEHVTNPSITKISVQKETQPLLWAVRSDGALLAMIYNRDDASIQAGWTRHILGGQSDASGSIPIVKSIGVIPSPDTTFDQLWLVVQRWINGASIVTIEYMTKIFDALANQDDAFQGDCGATYSVPLSITGITIADPAVFTVAAHGFSNGQRVLIDEVVGVSQTTTDINGNATITSLLNENSYLVANVTTNTFTLTTYEGVAISSVGYGNYVSSGKVYAMVKNISGLTWLKNETVGILTDGGIHPDVVVSNAGAITLNYPAAKVQIGYRYNSDGKMMRIEGGAADGSSIGKTRRTSRAAFQVFRMSDLSIGTNFLKLIPVKFPVADNQKADQAPPLFSGIKREGLESAYDFESQICFRQNSMLPGAIQSITSFMEEQDV